MGGDEGSKSYHTGRNRGELGLYQRRRVLFSSTSMAIGGGLFLGAAFAWILYLKDKPEATVPLELCKKDVGAAPPEGT